MARDTQAHRLLPAVIALVPIEVSARSPVRREWRPSDRLIFRCHADGRVTVDEFPEETDIHEALVQHVARIAPELLWLHRERLYVQAANGEAVYVPVGPSRVPGCTRYGRLYRRLPDGEQ
jgi:hypothetical protein